MPGIKPLRAVALGLAFVLFHAAPGKTQSAPDPLSSIACGQAISAAESLTEIPQHLLHAIALVESGISPGAGKSRVPWPWTVMAQGRGRYFRNRADAVAEVRDLLRQGVFNIDVGCMQVNLRYHGLAFQSLEEAFDPVVNVAYAARFLQDLHGRHGNWDAAVKHYHSATPRLHNRYRTKVRSELIALKRTGAPMTSEQHARSARAAAAEAAAAAPPIPRQSQTAQAASNQPPTQAEDAPPQTASRAGNYLKLAQWPPQSYRSQQQAEFHARARVFYPPAADAPQQ